MYMLWMLGLNGLKQEKARHAEFSHDVPDFTMFREPHRDTLAVPVDPLKRRTEKPVERAAPFPDDIPSSNPTVGKSRAEKTRAKLLRNDFSFRQFGHGTSPQGRAGTSRKIGTPLGHDLEKKRNVAT